LALEVVHIPLINGDNEMVLPIQIGVLGPLIIGFELITRGEVEIDKHPVDPSLYLKLAWPSCIAVIIPVFEMVAMLEFELYLEVLT
jgi:hypothetical protein